MADNDGKTSILFIMFIIVAGLMAVALWALVIYLYTYTMKSVKELQTSITEIKSKIGSMIRDINLNSQNEFKVEMEQQSSLNSIISRLS